jgi:prepilin-type N-terminal cleavage/methylation domain-containing protein
MKLSAEKSLRPAFTIVELLMTIAVLGMLLVAIAVAFEASVGSYQANEDVFRVVTTASQALTRIAADLRTATAVDTNEAASQCSLITAAGKDITYRFNSADGKLYLITNDTTADSDYVLCENISSLTFTRTTAVDDVGLTYVKSVQINLDISKGSFSRHFSTAVVVRKNL